MSRGCRKTRLGEVENRASRKKSFRSCKRNGWDLKKESLKEVWRGQRDRAVFVERIGRSERGGYARDIETLGNRGEAVRTADDEKVGYV